MRSHHLPPRTHRLWLVERATHRLEQGTHSLEQGTHSLGAWKCTVACPQRSRRSTDTRTRVTQTVAVVVRARCGLCTALVSSTVVVAVVVLLPRLVARLV